MVFLVYALLGLLILAAGWLICLGIFGQRSEAA